MEKTVEKVGNWASNISSIGKVLIALFIFIFAVGTAWYQIETNKSDNVRQDENIKSIIGNQQEQFDRMMESVGREFKVQSSRSDKRYKRAMEEAKELRDIDKKHEKQLLDLLERVSFIEGRRYEQDKNK
jgi:hypothetical protein